MDGGMLLHSLTFPWTKGATYGAIADAYVEHVRIIKQGYATPNVTVVFDGYGTSSTKDHAHNVRNPIKSLQVEITRDTIFNSQMKVILSNPSNKQKFVSLIADGLRNISIVCVRSEADADLEIVKAGLLIAKEKPLLFMLMMRT